MDRFSTFFLEIFTMPYRKKRIISVQRLKEGMEVINNNLFEKGEAVVKSTEHHLRWEASRKQEDIWYCIGFEVEGGGIVYYEFLHNHKFYVLLPTDYPTHLLWKRNTTWRKYRRRYLKTATGAI